MQITQTKIPGCYVINIFKNEDERGSFVKTFHKDMFKANNLAGEFVESYYSCSKKGVIRGLHFQIPPMEHIKVVHCPRGRIMDVVLDLRVGSPTYGRHDIVELSDENGSLIYVPAGLAHGFAVMSSDAMTAYNVTSVYSQECDCGILWNSAGIRWPYDRPILSDRDQSFAALNLFESPFVYDHHHIKGEIL